MTGKCPICGEFQFLGHKCKPRWAVFVEDEGDPRSVFAEDEQRAAEEVARDYDNGDYHLMKGNEMFVRVCSWRAWQDIADLESVEAIDHAIDRLPKWAVEGYSVPEYKATKIKDEADA